MKKKELIKLVKKTPFIVGNITINCDITIAVKLVKKDLLEQLNYYDIDNNTEFFASLTKDKTNLFIG